MIYNIIIYLIQKMFSKIFLFVLLLTCIYTYMLQSIENNNNTNFQKLPDNSNFELNGIKAVKPDLKTVNMDNIEILSNLIFGKGIQAVEKFVTSSEHHTELYTKDLISKLKRCENSDDIKKVFDSDMLPVYQKELNIDQ